MRKYVLLLLCSLSCFIYAESYVPATVPNPKGAMHNGWICDPAGYLSTSQARQITDACNNIKEFVDVEVAIVMLPAYDRQRYDRFTFCQELFNLWGIGGKQRNTGVLVFFADGQPGSRDIRIHTGGGMEGLLTDYACSSLIDDAYDYLVDGQFGNGVLKIVEGLYSRLMTTDAQAELTLGWAPKHFDEDAFAALLYFLLFLFVAVWLLCYAYYRSHLCKQCGAVAVKQTNMKIISQPTYTTDGKRQLTFTCACCGNTFYKTQIIPHLVRAATTTTGTFHSSGGFSGGSWGGGHSFGGGAGRGF